MKTRGSTGIDPLIPHLDSRKWGSQVHVPPALPSAARLPVPFQQEARWEPEPLSLPVIKAQTLQLTVKSLQTK